MGCDIHVRVQVRRDGQWEDYKWFDEAWHPGRWDNEESWPTAAKAYDGLESRNYKKFAILAGVRNGFGFAGIPWGKPIEHPIAEDRGWPEDFTPPNANDDYGYMGDHSFTWMTLAEILAWPDWEKPMELVGVVHKDAPRDAQGRPLEYCGDVSGKGSKNYQPETWQALAKDEVGWFWSETVPYLRTLADNPEDVRLVLGFDS